MKQKSLTPDRIMQFAWGYAPTLVIEAAVRHGIFDLLDKGPLTAAQIASKAGASLRGINGLVDVLVSIQLLARNKGRLSLTPESATFLVSSKPSYYGMLFAHISGQLLPSWLQLTEIVRTGRPAAKVNRKQGAAFLCQIRRITLPAKFSRRQRARPGVHAQRRSLRAAERSHLCGQHAGQHRCGGNLTFAEMSQWLRRAGFKNPRLLDVPSVSPLVLADKPK